MVMTARFAQKESTGRERYLQTRRWFIIYNVNSFLILWKHEIGEKLLVKNPNPLLEVDFEIVEPGVRYVAEPTFSALWGKATVLLHDSNWLSIGMFPKPTSSNCRTTLREISASRIRIYQNLRPVFAVNFDWNYLANISITSLQMVFWKLRSNYVSPSHTASLNTAFFPTAGTFKVKSGACCCVPKVSLSPKLPCAHGLFKVHFHARAGSKYIFVIISSSFTQLRRLITSFVNKFAVFTRSKDSRSSNMMSKVSSKGPLFLDRITLAMAIIVTSSWLRCFWTVHLT